MRETYDHEYPPGEWSASGIATALTDADGSGSLPRYDDAATWEEISSDPLTRPVVELVLEKARAERDTPVPPLPASRYLDYERTGNRSRYQNLSNERRVRLSVFTLAECFERDGDYLDPILDYAWAICEEATWLWPAHLDEPQNVEGLPGAVPDGDRTVALFSVGAALLLAEVDYVMGERLHPALRERIRDEVDRRVFTPYEARDDHRWLGPPTNNWNAVCNAGIGIAALHLVDDVDRRARIVEKAAHSMRHYLNDFDEAGCTAEGIGYWNYGFGNYVKLAAELEARTDGAYSLLSPPVVERIAAYPLKVELSPGHFLPFSDAEEDGRVKPATAAWLGRRLEHRGLAARGRWDLSRHPDPFAGRNIKNLPELLRDLAWTRQVPEDWEIPTPDRRTFFEGFDWWIVRNDPENPDDLVVAAKNGHNAESHNHNDCGTFVAHYRGESLLTDLGRPVYDRDFFSDRRYEYLTARSLGHSVPLVNGHEQRPGEEYAADVLDRAETPERDTFALELAGCYPEAAGLDSLRRELTLERGEDPTLGVEDVAGFASAAADDAFESILVSYFPMAATDGTLTVTGERGKATVAPTEGADVTVERLEDAVDQSWRDGVDYRDVWRARITPPEANPASLALEVGFEPID
jgi:hypothetical protein